MEVEDGATTPEGLAAAIHRQLGDISGPIPVHAIALALDIHDIREKPLRNFEGALQTDAERDFGIILVNQNSSLQRRRYSIGHELGHFLCGWHKRTDREGFRCRQTDMVVTVGDTDNLRQEGEANRFAIELLAPTKLVGPFVKKLPGLEHVVEMSSCLEISKAAAARRYVDLHSANLAVVFSQRGRYKYSHKTTGFPWIPFNAGDMIPSRSGAKGSNPSDLVEVDSDEWFGKRKDGTLWMQVLEQENGHATTLLEFEARCDDGDEDERPED